MVGPCPAADPVQERPGALPVIIRVAVPPGLQGTMAGRHDHLGGREELVATLANLAANPDTPPMVQVTHHVEEIPPGFTHGLLLDGGQVAAAGLLATVLTSKALSQCYGMDLHLSTDAGRWTIQVDRTDR